MEQQNILKWGLTLNILGISIVVFENYWNKTNKIEEIAKNPVGIFSVYSPDSLLLASISKVENTYIRAKVRSLELSNYNKELLEKNPDLLVTPVFQDSEGNIAHSDHRINIYLHQPLSENELKKTLQSYGFNLEVEVKPWREGKRSRFHTLQLQQPFLGQPLEALSQRVGELPEVKISSPNLIYQATPTGYFNITDQYYTNQWEHEKIRSYLAWMVTQGDGQVRIGIMDNGIDHTHYDLDANIWKDGQGNVLGGDFTSDGFSTGYPYGDESHGTHAAGIAAAPINGTGVVGAAPNVKLVPLKIATGQSGTSRSWAVDQSGLISAFYYAINNDIDILSLSWGLSQWNGNISIFNQSISDAINDGRDGKGIILVTSAGNTGINPGIDLISQNINMISVGATNPQDQRWPNSSYGTGFEHFVDIAAPSGWTQSEGVYSYATDIEGSNGDNSGDFTAYFGGTSAAAPLVAGAAALVLSIDNTLTQQEVKDILYSSAQKVGGYSYTYGVNSNESYELGHGRLNTLRAVAFALPNQKNSQTFSSSSTLSSPTHIYGSTTIASGVTLTLSAGKLLVLRGTINGTNSKIKSYGKVIIEEGTILNNVEIIMENGGYLIADDIGLDGKGIVFKSGSDGEVTNSGIQNAGKGVDIYGSATPLIQGNWIGDNATGIYVQSGVGSGAKIIDNYIYENSTQGIISYYSSPTIQYNYIYDTGYGFFGLGSSASFYRNRFVQANYGLFLINSPVQNAQRNYMRPIDTDMIHVESSATVVMQNNDIMPTSGTDYAVRAKYGATVIAYNNYWSSYPSGYFYATQGSNIYYTHGGPYVPEYHKTNGKITEEFSELDCQSRYEEIRSILEAQEQTSELQRNLLTTKAGCWRASGKDGFIQYLNSEIRPGLNKESKLYATTLELENLFLMDSGEYDKAIQNFEEIKNNFSSDDQLHQQALFGLGYVYSIIKEDGATGIPFFKELVEKYPESELAKNSYYLADAFDFSFEQKREEVVVHEMSLSNHPNPFNPTTQISFTLPEQAFVKLKVFNLIGREVADLVNSELKAGEHEVNFNAANLASGIYLYRLEVGNSIITQKMTLIK